MDEQTNQQIAELQRQILQAKAAGFDCQQENKQLQQQVNYSQQIIMALAKALGHLPDENGQINIDGVIREALTILEAATATKAEPVPA